MVSVPFFFADFTLLGDGLARRGYSHTGGNCRELFKKGKKTGSHSVANGVRNAAVFLKNLSLAGKACDRMNSMDKDLLNRFIDPPWAEPLVRVHEDYRILPFVDGVGCSVIKCAKATSNKDIIYIGSRQKRKCRFCGKAKGTVPFKKRAHAIPEFLDNHRIISYEECDECNDFFAKTVEDNLAKFLNLYNTISAVKGKNGVPTYKPKSEGFRVGYDEGKGLDIQATENFFRIDEESKTLRIEIESKPYIPCEAWRCFVKMALSLMPHEKLKHFETLRKWLRDGDIAHPPFGKDVFRVLFTFSSHRESYYEMQHLFLERIDDSKDIFYMMYAIAFKHFTFQIILPSDDKDKHLNGKKINFTVPSSPFLFLRSKGMDLNNAKAGWIDFSGIERTTEKQSADFSFKVIEKGNI